MIRKKKKSLPPFASAVRCTEGHELILHAIAASGVRKIFFCGGTDNFHFMESVARFRAQGLATPDLVTVPHESDALYMGMGYFQVTRRPQVVLLHVDSGTINAGAAWPEAWHAGAGVVVMAGRTPWTTKNELPGARSVPVHWQQEVYDQAGIVRQYTKWDYELKTAENASLVVRSAFRIAATEPCGPVYVTLPREVMAAKMERGIHYRPEDFPRATAPAADPAALGEAARLLCEAQNPVVLVKGMGRHPEAVAALVALAERFALPVCSTDAYMNFPAVHWARSAADIGRRDCILVIDHDVPWVGADPPRTTRIISMDLDPVRLKQPLWGFPVHVPITCDSASALPLLAGMMERRLTPARRGVIRERRKALEQAHRAALVRRAKEIGRASRAFPLSPVWVRECVNRVSDENTVLLWDIAAIGQGDRTPPGHLFAQYAANLGSSWPRAVGVKMAAPEKTVISSGGDGCTLFANPEAVLWTARKYDAPVLYIVNNNHRYQAVAENLEAYGGDESHAGRAGYNGASLSPSPDFAAVARAMGAYGETVTRPEQMEGSLGRALAALKEGRSAILDTVTVKPEPSS